MELVQIYLVFFFNFILLDPYTVYVCNECGSTALTTTNADSHHYYERHDLLIISRSRVSSISYCTVD